MNRFAQKRLEAKMRMSSGASSEELSERLSDLRERNLLIEEWMLLLSEDEAFVIQRHLIDGMTWPKLEAEYAAKWNNFAKCTRTLMRYQKQALKIICRYMNELDH